MTRRPAESTTGGIKVVGFLQNQWFRDPDRAKLLLNRCQEHEECPHAGRERFIRDMLFFGCLTGKRLEQAFGEDLCGHGGIVWEESSRHVGGRADSSAPADAEHMAEVIGRHKPRVIVTFGETARCGLALAMRVLLTTDRDLLTGLELLHGPHPAARGGTVSQELQAVTDQLRPILFPQGVGR